MTTALYIPRHKFHGFYDGHQFHRLDATATKTAVPEILRGVIIAEVGLVSRGDATRPIHH
jgi:hypothetical protein